jgi:hypothetical protein
MYETLGSISGTPTSPKKKKDLWADLKTAPINLLSSTNQERWEGMLSV